MAEEQSQQTPLIDPGQVKEALKRPVEEPVTNQPARRKQPTAEELQPGQYCWGTGRRKSAIARVRIRPGKGAVMVNKKELKDYFPDIQCQRSVCAPLVATELSGQFDVFIRVHGGGPTGQAGAAMLGVARALAVADPNCYTALKNGGYLTRDSRMKERKKYGQRGARRSFQFSKR